MILIVNNEVDFTTDQVCLWLNKRKKDYVRISNTKLITWLYSDSVDKLKVTLTHHKTAIDLASLKSIFYKNNDFGFYLNVGDSQAIDSNLAKFMDAEWQVLKEYLKFVINKNALLIGNIFYSAVNKLIVLNMASAIALKIPETRIVTTREDVDSFRMHKAKIITKPISEVSFQSSEKGKFLNYTRIVDKDEFIADNIAPTLLQEYIEKKYEIRTYFQNDQFWSIAIFSQSQSQTNTDYRNYNYDLSNRSEPFLLPAHLQEKVQLLANKLQLNSGSADFIYTPGNEFYFLEINPLGQFSNVSLSGNYNIEKHIATQL